MAQPGFPIEIGTCCALGAAIVLPGEVLRWLEREMEASLPGSALRRDPADLCGEHRGSLGRRWAQLSVPPPRARLPAGNEAFQMCKPGLRLELLTGGPERDRENARVSGPLGTGTAASEAASKNPSAEGLPAGLRRLYFPGPLSPI